MSEGRRVPDLARRLVAAPGWRWVAGMLARMPAEGRYPACDCRIVEASFPGISGYMPRLGLVGLDLSAVPDLDDPATAGVLLAELPGSITVERDADVCSVSVLTEAGHFRGGGPTLGRAVAEALIAVRSA